MRSRCRIAVVFLLVVGLLAGCRVVQRIDTGDLEAAVAALPGVAAVSVSYDDDAAFGSIVTLNAEVPRATPDEITGLIDTVNQHRGDHLERVRLYVADGRSVSVAATAEPFDGARFAADTEAVRRLRAAVEAPQIMLSRRDEGDGAASLDVRQLSSPVPAALGAVRAAVTGEIDVTLYPVAETGAPQWRVRYPFTAEQQQRIEAQLAAMPATPVVVGVGPGGVLDALTVAVPDPATAAADLAAVVSAAGAGADRPLMLAWRLPGKKPVAPDSGTVDVGGCDYPDTSSERDPGKYLSPAEIDLQQRLRAQFDTC